MARWKAYITTTETEHQAALNGLNIFFGAILGVGLAGIQDLEPLPYTVLLVGMAAIVTSILYISASPKRVRYAVGLIAVLTVVQLTRGQSDLLVSSIPLPEKLILTLIVWTAAAAIVEFSPREKVASSTKTTEIDSDLG